MSKPFTLYSHNGGPNGWKVAMVLEELGLEYESIYLDFQSGEHKQESHTKYNPNGRIPTLICHEENDHAIWESNAIILYLVGKYDKEHKISIDMTNLKDMASLNQWLFFQASGQGPYFGQAAWFSLFHSEKLPSAIERYQNEVLRVFGVLESVLSKQQYLVGDGSKLTVADLSFIPWNAFAGKIMGDKLDMAKFPSVQKWTDGMHARPAIGKVLGEWQSKQKKN
jgi:glutathione S-transferase